VTQWYHFQQNINVQKFMVYNVGGHSAIDLIDQGKAYFLSDTVLGSNSDKISYHITPHRIKAGIRNTMAPGESFQRQLPGCLMLVWKGKSFLRIYDSKFFLPDSLSVDFVIVSNNAVKNIEELSSRVQMRQLILDSSNSHYFTTQILKKSNTISAKIYSVLHHGAFELNI
jgi:competence protein ComEC